MATKKENIKKFQVPPMGHLSVEERLDIMEGFLLQALSTNAKQSDALLEVNNMITGLCDVLVRNGIE